MREPGGAQGRGPSVPGACVCVQALQWLRRMTSLHYEEPCVLNPCVTRPTTVHDSARGCTPEWPHHAFHCLRGLAPALALAFLARPTHAYLCLHMCSQMTASTSSTCVLVCNTGLIHAVCLASMACVP